MPLLRLIAENIGPFEKLDIDFSDGNGKPHQGPQILAGVNGSGKSTVLRAIAWVTSWSESGFPLDDWWHLLRGPQSRVLLQFAFGNGTFVNLGIGDEAPGWEERIEAWCNSMGVHGRVGQVHSLVPFRSGHVLRDAGALGQPHIGAYAPARTLSYLPPLAFMKPLKQLGDGGLGFDTTVQNAAIQHWLVDLFSKRALAKERSQEFAKYEQTLNRFQDALKLFCGDSSIGVDVELRPVLEPRVSLHGKKLNFSQLSDGVRTTMGWLADFMMRQDQTEAANGASDSILLLDEVDMYLHPRLQRTLLPAIRKALPEVQVIAATHSPFVISSCAEACVHVLKVDEHGVAHADPPQRAPFGESIMATLKDIFGVESRFDVQTERDLKAWDNLKQKEAVAQLSQSDREKLGELSQELSERSEEVRLIVESPPTLSADVLQSLTNRSSRQVPGRHTKRNGNRPPRTAKR